MPLPVPEACGCVGKVGAWLMLGGTRVLRASLNPGYKSEPYHEAILGKGLIVDSGWESRDILEQKEADVD